MRALPYLDEGSLEDVYTADLTVKHNARPLTREAVKVLAKADPLGVNARMRERS